MSNRLYNLPGTIVLYDDESMFGGVTYEIDVNGEDDLVAGTVAFASVRFNVYDASTLKEGEGFIWSRRQMGDQVYANIGVFYVQSIEKKKDYYEIVAVDGNYKLDIPIYNFLQSNVSYPNTHIGLVRAICDYCGMVFDESQNSMSAFSNFAMPVYFNPAWQDATARDIVSLICEASGCFAKNTLGSTLSFGWYKESGVVVTNDDVSGAFVADYAVPKITTVTVSQSYDDAGYTVGTGSGSWYSIVGNTLFSPGSSTQDTDMRRCAATVLLKLQSVPEYYPCELPMFNDLGLVPGSIFSFNEKTCIVMSIRYSNTGTVISCKGNKNKRKKSALESREVFGIRRDVVDLKETVKNGTPSDPYSGKTIYDATEVDIQSASMNYVDPYGKKQPIIHAGNISQYVSTLYAVFG